MTFCENCNFDSYLSHIYSLFYELNSVHGIAYSYTKFHKSFKRSTIVKKRNDTNLNEKKKINHFFFPKLDFVFYLLFELPYFVLNF